MANYRTSFESDPERPVAAFRRPSAEPDVLTEAVAVPARSKDELAAEAGSWAARARGLRIIDRESCVHASQLLVSIKHLRVGIAEFWTPHVEAAMETKRKAETARKALVEEQARMEAPLIEAEGVLKRSLLAFESEQERVRLEQERALQAEANRAAEAATLAAAAALELEANATGDPAMLQEAKNILAQPMDTPVVTVARMVPKVQGVTFRDNWKAHDVIDLKALAAAVAAGTAPVTFLQPNMTAINQFAKATKGEQAVSGIKFYNDRGIAARA